jgi:excisionase family DNA binding protein
MSDRLTFGVKEAADAMGLSHWTVRKMIADGRLPVVRINRRVLIEPEVLRQLIERHRTPAKPGSS